jgi:8-oxo-dGTP pyrophosphatase MutT (NUDIX family)
VVRRPPGRRTTLRGGVALEFLPHDQYVARLPRKSMSAAVLLRDATGAVLLLKPSYKPGWDLPGGVVELSEAPWTTAARELREEVGLTRPRGRLLVVDHVPPDTYPERVAFVFDGGRIDPAALGTLTLSDEVVSAALCPPSELHESVNPRLASRIRAAIRAITTGEPAMCEGGIPV